MVEVFMQVLGWGYHDSLMLYAYISVGLVLMFGLV